MAVPSIHGLLKRPGSTDIQLYLSGAGALLSDFLETLNAGYGDSGTTSLGTTT